MRPRRRCGAHRACWGASGGNPVPCRVLWAAARSWLLMSSLGAAQRSAPTLNVVREILGRSTSSSSSHVWKLGTGPLSAGQVPTRPVGPLWVVSVRLLSTRGQLDRRAQRPLFVHLHSPGCPLFVPMPCARRPARTPGRRPPVAPDSEKAQVRGEPTGEDPAAAVRRASSRTGIGTDLPNLCTFLGTTSRRVDRIAGRRRASVASELGFRCPRGCTQLWTATCRRGPGGRWTTSSVARNRTRRTTSTEWLGSHPRVDREGRHHATRARERRRTPRPISGPEGLEADR